MQTSESGRGWQNVWGWLALAAITALAAWFRFDALDLKPLHHDEGVNAQFMAGLLKNFHYKYNPNNFHGPLLYFLTLPVVKLE